MQMLAFIFLPRDLFANVCFLDSKVFFYSSLSEKFGKQTTGTFINVDMALPNKHKCGANNIKAF